MTAEDEALKLALHGLEMGVTLIEDFGSKEQLNTQHKAIAAIYEALAQPEQEPVAWFSTLPDGRLSIKIVGKPTEGNWEPLYTTPPQRAWEPVETAPKDGTDVLLMYMHIDTQVVHNGFWIGASDADDESEIGWWSYDYSEVTRIKLDDWMTPTHWLPLPKLKEKNT